MRARVLLLMANAALLLAVVLPHLKNSSGGWSDGHGFM
jgi:hypothetical protein